MKRRYTVALDFDGVIHSYTTPWINARTIPDDPVPGALVYIKRLQDSGFDVAITSTRNSQFLGTWAMKRWLVRHIASQMIVDRFPSKIEGHSFEQAVDDAMSKARQIVRKIQFPKRKPPALVYIDDRAYRFNGFNWPSPNFIHDLRPWNKPKQRVR